MFKGDGSKDLLGVRRSGGKFKGFEVRFEYKDKDWVLILFGGAEGGFL